MTDTMPEKIDLSSVRPSNEKLAALRDLIPEAFSEGKIDFDALRRSLGDAVDTAPREERFGLRWPGKSKLQQVINQPSVGTLVPQPEESVDWDTTQNMIIEGDNLEVLKLLQKSYAGKVKMIYIDPPYNTGNDFVYPDNHVEGLQSYLEFTGQIDENGYQYQANTESDGRFHANWLNMMYPRLYLARTLLRQDGAILVSVDDSERDRLRLLMDEIFGEDNLVAAITHKNKAGAGAKPRGFISVHEYVLVYMRDKEILKGISLPMTAEQRALYNKKDEKYTTRGPYGTWALSTTSMADRPNLRFPIHYKGEDIWPEKQWLWSRERVEQALAANELVFNKKTDGKWSVRFKRYLKDEAGEANTATPTTVWDGPYTHSGTRDFAALFSDKVFSFPKPVELLQKLLSLDFETDPVSEKDIVLDFFAGSGTAAHAVMQQNAEDEGNRKYILVQLPEPMEEPKTLDDGTTVRTIADICRERVRRAGKKIAEENEGKNLDTGFRAYRLASSNFRPWDGRIRQQDGGDGIMTTARQASFMPQTIQQQLELAADHLRPDANDESLLAELLLRLGFELTTPVAKDTLAGKTVYNVDEGLVLICLDRHITLDVIEAMAKRMPDEIICLDAGFPDDGTKVNAGQIIASHARDEETSIAFKVV